MYHWKFDPPSYERAFDELPVDAKAALLAVLEALMFDPADYDRQPDEPEGKALRMIKFGAGRGILTFVHHEPDRLVLVVRITWFG